MQSSPPATSRGTLPASEAVEQLRSAAAVRQRCTRILAAGRRGELSHFAIDDACMPAVVNEVVRVTLAAYPTLDVPLHSRWRHFDVDGIDRVAPLRERMDARAAIDLAVVSVLLDAGAGPRWRFVDRATATTHARSEGLAVASLRAFEAGLFSVQRDDPLRVDAAALARLSDDALADAFAVTADNPLVGVGGRAELMRALGRVLADVGRPSALFEPLLGSSVAAEAVLRIVLERLGPIWPGRLRIDDEPLGDVWPHPAAGGHGASAGLVPLHKLSQWLTYSLVEPLRWGGTEVRDLDALTGLGEYRNGGLLLDLGVLRLRDPGAASRSHRVDAPLVVEWRALTVALLDEVAAGVRTALGRRAADLPLPCILQGGTWAAGRAVAAARRADGAPPLAIESDGTVF